MRFRNKIEYDMYLKKHDSIECDVCGEEIEGDPHLSSTFLTLVPLCEECFKKHAVFY